MPIAQASIFQAPVNTGISQILSGSVNILGNFLNQGVNIASQTATLGANNSARGFQSFINEQGRQDAQQTEQRRQFESDRAYVTDLFKFDTLQDENRFQFDNVSGNQQASIDSAENLLGIRGEQSLGLQNDAQTHSLVQGNQNFGHRASLQDHAQASTEKREASAFERNIILQNISEGKALSRDAIKNATQQEQREALGAAYSALAQDPTNSTKQGNFIAAGGNPSSINSGSTSTSPKLSFNERRHVANSQRRLQEIDPVLQGLQSKANPTKADLANITRLKGEIKTHLDVLSAAGLQQPQQIPNAESQSSMIPGQEFLPNPDGTPFQNGLGSKGVGSLPKTPEQFLIDFYKGQ